MYALMYISAMLISTTNRGAEIADRWGMLLVDEKSLWEGDIWAEIKYEKLFDAKGSLF